MIEKECTHWSCLHEICAKGNSNCSTCADKALVGLAKLKETNISPLTKEGMYILHSEECGLKVGDRVKVTRKANDYENGWNNTWVSDMDDMINNAAIIIALNHFSGYKLKNGKNYAFPYFVLEKV